MAHHPYAGTGTLARLMLRRERIRITLWALAVTVFIVASAHGFADLYPTQEQRDVRAQMMENPAFVAFRGPGHGLDHYTIGAMVAHELFLFAAIAIAFMSLNMVVRHTRVDEETGRTELVRARSVGRYAVITAALLIAGLANLLIACMLALTLSATLDVLPLHGSLTFGLAVGSVGLFFAATGAVAAQLSPHSRSAQGVGVAVLAVTFLLRAAGDLRENVLSWLSPLGWAQATRPYVDEQWWPMLLSVAVATLGAALAFALNARRDVGAGLVPPKPGPAEASSQLVRPVGLALRLHRGGLVAWGTALCVFGIVGGAVVGEIGDFLADNPRLAEFLAASGDISLGDSILAMVVLLLASLSAGYAVQVACQPLSEENAGRVELLRATAIGRWRWVASHIIVATTGGSVVLLLGSLSMGITAAVGAEDWSYVVRLLGAGLGYLPAVWVLVGLAAALYGSAPRLVRFAWLVVVYGAGVGLMGDVISLPTWAASLSPFYHVPALPGVEVSWVPLLLLTVLAAAMLCVARVGVNRRDLGAA